MSAEHDRVLVAGVGNVFLGDDGFGVEVLRRLAAEGPFHGADLVDSGIRGVDLAYRLLDGYRTAVLLDATARGGAPGTVYRIETDLTQADSPAAVDGHHMTPDAVLALLGTLSAGTGSVPPERFVVVGCEPADVEEGIGLSPAVADAVPEAVRIAREVLAECAAGPSVPT